MIIESEKVLERKLSKHIEKLGGFCWKLFPIHITGLPDRLCLLPGAIIFFVEVKTTNEEPKRRQLYVHKQLRNLGFRVEIVDTSEQIKKLLSDYE